MHSSAHKPDCSRVGGLQTFERSWIAFSVDGVSSVVGALLGTSPVTCFIESASGIREGGRTGLTALTVAFFFFVALFFSPLLGGRLRLPEQVSFSSLQGLWSCTRGFCIFWDFEGLLSRGQQAQHATALSGCCAHLLTV